MDKIVKMLLDAIHAKCRECFQKDQDIRDCDWVNFCPLHPFRNGKIPNKVVADQKKGGNARG